jgi:HSP20 family molecular chaperone IbpA
MTIIPWNQPSVSDYLSNKRSLEIDVHETKTAIIIEINGFKVNPKTFEIFIKSGVLFVRNNLLGEKGEPIKGPRDKVKAKKKFEKIVKLPVTTDIHASRAVVEDDVLRITVLKATGKTLREKVLEIETSS